ncbi:MAG: peptidoglycan D,D-transpeptidase FtsI family protein [Verrucomicrobiota bacterium]
MKWWNLRTRGFAVVVLFAMGFSVVSARLIYLQLIRHEYYREEAIKMHYVGVPISPKRGAIRDREGHVLAQTVSVTDLRIDGQLAWQDPMLFDRLAVILGVETTKLKNIVRPEKRYQLLAENIEEDIASKLRSLKARALIFKERMQRVYPNGEEGSHVLGFVNSTRLCFGQEDQTVEFEVGMDGVEKALDRYLRGVPGERRVVRDASRREIAAYRQSDRPARNGMDVILTVDQVIQHIVETEADRLMQNFQPDAAHIIVMKPSTGEILGMANRPTFDPNNRESIEIRNLKNAAIMNIYEPGSTFKVVTLAAALNEGVVDLDTPIYCENGKFFYAGKWLNDTHAHGMLTLREVVAKSSNIGFAKLGLLLGQDKVYQYVRRFGFGEAAQRSLRVLPGEEAGVLHPLKKWSSLSITRVPVGYEIAVTNLQMATAYAAIANGGKLMEPLLVRAVVNDKGRPVSQYLPKIVRQVVRPEIAAQMRHALEKVVSDEGTATLASVHGFTVAGKTGTAQKLVNGAYDHENYVSSFIGFLPAEKPEFLVSIVVDRPRGRKYYGGSVAGPSFSNIATQVAQQLNMITSDAVVAIARKGDEL